MPSTERLSEFAAVVAAGSISAAARALDVPRATLSRRLSGLEAELGVRLMHRSSRRLTLTDAGRELHHRARRIAADAEAAWAAVRRMDDVPRGLLRVSTAGPFLDELMVGLLEDFPELSLEVWSTDRHVDLVADGVDVAVRFGEVRDRNLIVRRVAAGRRVVVGAPAYFDAHGRPQTPDALAAHACLVDFAGTWQPARAWPRIDGGTVRVGGRLTANRLALHHEAARAGLGLALLPHAVVRRDIERGRLEVVLDGQVGADASVSIVYVDRTHLDPKIRLFVDRAVPVLGAAFGRASR